MYKILISFIFILGLIYCSGAQTDTVYRADISIPYFKSYVYDLRDIALVPVTKNDTRIVPFCVAATSICGMFMLDEEIQRFSQKHRTKNTEWVSENMFEPIGSGIYSCSALALFYTQGLVFKNDRSRKVALNGIKSFLLASLVAQVPKTAFRRIRPDESYGNAMNWFGDIEDKSFISGHTTAAFAALSSIAIEYKEKPWVSIVCYSLATITGYSRVHDNRHWASDVVGGAFLGYGVAALVHNANNWGVAIYPYVDSKSVSVSMTIPMR